MSHKRALRTAAALAASAALTLVPAVASHARPEAGATAARKSLNVRPQVQQEENWCWATTGLTVTQYLGHGAGKSQNDFCKAGFNFDGYRCPDEPGQMYNVQNGARAFGAKTGSVRSTLTFSQIQQGIDANSPMPAGYYWRGGGGHMVAIIGYDSNSQEIMINDSYPTHRRQVWMKYSDFVSNSQWRWAQSIYGMAKGSSSGGWATRALQQNGPEAVEKRTAESTSVAVESADRSAVAQSVKADAVTSRVAALLSETKSTTVAAKDVTVDANPVQVMQLNPDFIAGRSNVVTAKDTLASLARTASGDVAVVKFAQVDGAPKYSAVLTGDDEVRYTSMPGGGTVFQEVQNGAWYRLLDGKVLPLNDIAKKVVGEGKSVAEYQKIVQKKYADKMAGSLYQRLGKFGGTD